MFQLLEIIDLKSDNRKSLDLKRAIALGMMDGVHIGHQKLLEQAVKFAEQKESILSCAMTFREPPIKWTSKETKVELITTLKERLLLFKQFGVDQAVVFNFEEVSKLKANDYLNKILKENLNASFITCGSNHNYGSQKEGNSKQLQQWGLNNNIQIDIADMVHCDDSIKVSSSVIRGLLKEGKLKDSSKLLGHNFLVCGQVVEGKKIGSELGFPTLNIEYPQDKVLVPYGVYAAKTQIAGKEYKSAVNFGFAPTVSEERNKPILESHLLNFKEELFVNENNILVELIDFIRPEMKFESFDELKKQIEKDSNSIHEYY